MMFAVVLFVVIAIFFVCVTLLYDNVDAGARIAMYVIAGICVACAVFFPTATILSVRSYPKHKKLATIFVKEYAFVDEQLNNDDKQ